MVVDLLIYNVAQLVTCASPGGPKRQEAMSDVGLIVDGAVAVVDGEIVAVGPSTEVCADHSARKTIDASGKIVTPGLFAPLSQLGLVEVSLSAGPVDGEQRGEHFTAGFDVADAYNPRSTLIAVSRIGEAIDALV